MFGLEKNAKKAVVFRKGIQIGNCHYVVGDDASFDIKTADKLVAGGYADVSGDKKTPKEKVK